MHTRTKGFVPRFVFPTLLLTILGLALPGWPQDGHGVLRGLAEPQPFKALRISSHDRTGGNLDGGHENPLVPKETRELARITGPGAIHHLWFTVAPPDPPHLKNLVLSMYWDGETTPSVEVPLGDFFGLGGDRYYGYSCLPIQIGTERALNCFWYMPFSEGARITIRNDGEHALRALYYYVDYRKLETAPASPMRFHAQYRQAYPCQEGQNYTFLEAQGQGHYVGTNLSVHLRDEGWWGEGDDMIYVDGQETPSLHGTGSEDYFCGAWGYGEVFANPYFGMPLGGDHQAGEWWNVYRYHLEDPVPFRESIRVTMEHGHANDRADDFSSCAYWYQAEPHAAFPALPDAAQRMPAALEDYHVAGAIEMEDYAHQFGGPAVRAEPMAAHGVWSGGAQLALCPSAPEQFRIRFTPPIEEAGQYRAEIWYTSGPLQGQVELSLNGEVAAQWDGYRAEGVKRAKTRAVFTLKPGGNDLNLRLTGKNASASGYCAGLDCIRLTKQ